MTIASSRGFVSMGVVLALALAVNPWFMQSPVFGADNNSASWPGFLGPNRDGKSPDTGLLKEWPTGGPKLLWKADGLGNGYSTVAISDGRIFTTGDVNKHLMLFACDTEGKSLWKTEVGPLPKLDHPGARGTPCVDGGSVFLISADGLIGAYDVKTGQKQWTRTMKELGGKRPNWGYAECPLVLGNLLICTPGGEHCIAALDKATGSTVWSSTGEAASAQYGSCISFTFEDVPVICAGTGAGLVCADAKTGQILWTNSFSAGNTANCPTPAYSDGYVFWANGYGKGGVCMKLSMKDGKPAADVAWTTKDLVCHHGGYIINEGYIYGTNDKGWVCLDLKTGAKQWDNKGVGKGSICWADGMYYLFGENKGQAGLAAATPKGAQMKGDFKVEGDGPSWAFPVVIGGRLYLRYDANLYCFDVTAK